VRTLPQKVGFYPIVHSPEKVIASVSPILTHKKRKEQHIMFARLTVVQVKTDKIDEFIKFYRGSWSETGNVDSILRF
jgi:hypothetical protein